MDPTSTIAKALNRLSDSMASKAGHMTHAKGPTLNPAGVSRAEELIKAGKVNDGEWSFDAADEDALLGKNEDWDGYSKWFLATNAVGDAKPDEKSGYKYPFGKGGEVYVRALNAIRSFSSQQNATAIYDAAGKLLDMIKAKANA